MGQKVEDGQRFFPPNFFHPSTQNRPRNRNAVTAEMIIMLADTLDKVSIECPEPLSVFGYKVGNRCSRKCHHSSLVLGLPGREYSGDRRHR